jgi:hypothetical protein
MAEDGYLFLRGCLDREEVLAARHNVLAQLEAEGSLDPATPLIDGKSKPGIELQFRGDLAQKKQSGFATSALCSAGKPDALFLFLFRR